MRAALIAAGVILLAAAGVAQAQTPGAQADAAKASGANMDAGWQPLFNGKDLTGWEHVGPGAFTIEDGQLKGQGGMGLLWYTGKKFGDAVIRVVYKPVEDKSNSGVFIRIPEKPTEEWMPVNKGYEVQIDNANDDYHTTGVLYSLAKAMAKPSKPGQWNTMEITLNGPRTIVTINGVKVTDYTEGDPVPEKHASYEPDRGRRPDVGYIGLQNHSDKDIVYFKEVSVRPVHAAGKSSKESKSKESKSKESKAAKPLKESK